jgi:RimJ/RimL family protein N-acetyltransferase
MNRHLIACDVLCQVIQSEPIRSLALSETSETSRIEAKMSSPKVQLVIVLAKHKFDLKESKEQLAKSLGFRIPEGWPEFPEAFEPPALPNVEPSLWPGYFMVSLSDDAVVGNGGFAGKPRDGEVEIGYEVAPEFRGCGFATAAVSELLTIAFAHPEIEAVIAHTLAFTNASNAVLSKSGFKLVSELPNTEVGKVWRWRIAAAAYFARESR